jgi:excisionase family DNA binding protein
VSDLARALIAALDEEALDELAYALAPRVGSLLAPRLQALAASADEPLLSPKAAAARVSLSRATIYRAIRDGDLPARPVRGQWRIEREDLDRWEASAPTDRAVRRRPRAGRSTEATEQAMAAIAGQT